MLVISPSLIDELNYEMNKWPSNNHKICRTSAHRKDQVINDVTQLFKLTHLKCNLVLLISSDCLSELDNDWYSPTGWLTNGWVSECICSEINREQQSRIWSKFGNTFNAVQHLFYNVTSTLLFFYGFAGRQWFAVGCQSKRDRVSANINHVSKSPNGPAVVPVLRLAHRSWWPARNVAGCYTMKRSVCYV